MNENGVKDSYNKNKNVIANKPKQQGNSAEYRIAKLKRDYPEIAQRLKADELSQRLGIVELAKSVPVLNEHGGDRNQGNKKENVTLQRGNSTEYRIAKLKPVIAQKAKENQGARNDISQNSAKSNSIDTRQQLAKQAQVSHDTIAKTEFIKRFLPLYVVGVIN